MGFGKKDIVKNISSKALFSSKTSSLVLEAFLRFIKERTKNQVRAVDGGIWFNQYKKK